MKGWQPKLFAKSGYLGSQLVGVKTEPMIVEPYMMWPKFPKLASIVPAPSSIEATRVDGYITFS